MGAKRFLGNYLTLALIFSCGICLAQSDCKEVKASIEVFQAQNEAENGSIKINFNGQSGASFILTLIGPKQYYLKDIQETEIKGLKKGTYTLVVNGRKEQDNFCQKHFEFMIK
jgi:hypothetical protein